MMLDDAGFDRNDKIAGREPVQRKESRRSNSMTAKCRSMAAQVTDYCMIGSMARWM